MLVERHKKYAFNIALKILESAEDAEEVAHDSFVKAYQNLSRFNHDSKFSTWLYRITFNTAITAKRKRKVIKEDLEKAEHYLQADEQNRLEETDQKVYIEKALSRLSDKDRTIISLFYLKDFSLEEIGEITDMSPNTVKVRLHRCRKKLADEMKNILKEEALNL